MNFPAKKILKGPFLKRLSLNQKNVYASALFDALFLGICFLYFTGGDVLITSPLRQIIREQPWIHRMISSSLLLILVLSAFLITFKTSPRAQTNSFLLPLLLKFLKSKKLLVILLITHIMLMIASAWSRHETFNSGFDLAIFSQALWSTLHGKLLYSSIKGGICLLGDHFSPVLLLLTPFYALWTDPKCLLLIQVLASYSSALVLYSISQLRFRNHGMSSVVFIAYLLYLPLRNAARFDFHPEMLTDVLTFLAYYTFITNRLTASSSFLGLALTSKENIFASIFIFGLYAFLVQKKRFYGIFWMSVSLVYFFVVMRFIIPHFSYDPYFYIRGNYSLSWSVLAEKLISLKTIGYFIKIYSPLGFVSFFSPAVILTLPVFLQNVLAQNPSTTSIFFHYTAFLTPFVFISAVEGLNYLSNTPFFKAHEKRLILLVLISSCSMSGVSEFYIFKTYSRQDNSSLQNVREHLRQIPSNLSVRTNEFLSPHLSNRFELYIYENQHPQEGGSLKAQNTDLIVLHELFLANKDQAVSEILSRHYALDFNQDGLMIFRKSK